jgi:hypothetical protein
VTFFKTDHFRFVMLLRVILRFLEVLYFSLPSIWLKDLFLEAKNKALEHFFRSVCGHSGKRDIS